MCEAERVYREYKARFPHDCWFDLDEDWLCIGDYDPMIDHFGEILVSVSTDDYQGDTLVLYKSRTDDQYGILRVGWGSCTGCDALQACNCWEQVNALLNELRDSIIWGSFEEIYAYLNSHDWEADYINDDTAELFVKRAVPILEERELEV